MKIYGITPRSPTKDYEINDSKIAFSSLIAVGFKTKNIPTLHSSMNKM